MIHVLMTIEPFIKALHVMCGVTFVGLSVGMYFYITNSVLKKDKALLQYALKLSFWVDALLISIIVIQYTSATLLVSINRLGFVTPWIQVAYVVFTLVSVCWFMGWGIRIANYRRQDGRFRHHRLYHVLNIIMIVLFTLIIHDAVLHRTLFQFLWGGS